MATLRKMPSQAVPVIDMRTGTMTPEWYLYFSSREKAELSNLADVSSATPANGNKLTWNSTTKTWGPA